MKEKRIFVVLGMHRSGTSAITRSLEVLGIGLGGELHPAASDNPKGFWEDKDCLEINEALLSHLGSAYDKLAPAWESFDDDPDISRLKLKAAQVLLRKLEISNGVWGFKDPRTCRLLPFWQSVFDAIGCQVSYIIALRNPASVADSLSKRNETPVEKSYLLWVQHILPAILKTKGFPRIIIDYDEFMDSPHVQLQRMASALGLSIPERESTEIAHFEKDFLDQGLRHSRHTNSTLQLDSRAVKLVSRLHKILEAAAKDEASLDSDSVNQKIIEIQDELNSFTPAINYINTLESIIEKLWQNMGIITAQRDDLSHKLTQANEIFTAKNNEAQGLNEEIKWLNEKSQALERDFSQTKLELQRVYNSHSWNITRPLRAIRRLMGERYISQIRGRVATLLRSLWHKLPLSSNNKAQLKSILFGRLGFLLRDTQAYRSWYAMNFPDSPLPARRGLQIAAEKSVPTEPADCYVPLLRAPEPKNLPARLIAFYLPQFHAIKENNEWWGEGFTEWTNVRPARPQFEGHYQPHVPGELGYYNLLDRNVQKRQIELAKLYGVGGFCFYYYWFGGKRLLEQPIENYLADSELDHPFCLCWANENWSRRWDGKDSEVLIAQQHSPEDDLAFAADVARYMRDSRYIRIDGKPLLLVYRPSLLPSALETSERWRNWFREAGLGEVYLAYTQSFESEDPKKYGFDAAIEFPPNNSAPPNITSEVRPLDDSFAGTVYDWSALAKRSRNYKKMPYKLFRSVCPSWDNTARRKTRGTIFLGSSPKEYQEWLENAVAETCRDSSSTDERLIFVNAWNEWAEGAHLEPDQKYGYAWLEATRKALTGEPTGPHKESLAVVSHDAHPHGAQFLALGMVRSLAQDLKLNVHTVLLGEGRLKADFAQYSEVHEAYLGSDFEVRAEKLACELVNRGVRRAVVNTTVSGAIVKAFSAAGIRCVCLIHEMPGVIQSRNLQEQARSIAKYAHKVVFPASIVEEGFSAFADVEKKNSAIRPQGLWRRNLLRFRKTEVRSQVREKLGVALDAPLILAVGYADHRKGVDLFAQSALETLKHRPDALFVWIGHWDEGMRSNVEALIAGYEESFRFLGYEPDTAAYHAAADVYALTSREDPFPNVVLESFDAGVPVVAFAGTGGGAQLASEIGGRVVPPDDSVAFAGAVLELLQNPEMANSLADEASQLVDRDYSFRSYLFDLCAYLDIELPRISVVVPNYNYARYIQARLESIIKQTLPLFELIILDDASPDNSIERMTQWLTQNSVECRLVVNQSNSGSVFDQWAKGVSLATGDYVWIAEADDLSRPHFLETVIAPMEKRPDVCLSYCESQQIDQQGRRLSMDYHAYREDICADHWQAPFISEGRDEIINYLAVKNTIPNVSSAVFKREAIAEVFAENLADIRSLRRAGDWLAYVKVLEKGAVAFSPRPDNLHRRHAGSVIGSGQSRLIEEVSEVQSRIANEFELPHSISSQATSYLQQLRNSIKDNVQVVSG